MDLKIDNYSFKGAHAQTLKNIGRKACLLSGAIMGLGFAVSAQNITTKNDSFSKNTDYITLTTNKNTQANRKDITETLKKTKFFPEKDNEIIASILTSLGVESLGCISDNDNLEAFGECSKDLYKFYVRKSGDDLYYGIAEKLVGMEEADLHKPFENKNKTYAFIISDAPKKNSDECKQITYSELKHYDDEYCNDFIFGNEIYDKANDIEKFKTTFLNNNVKNIIYDTKQ